MGFCLRALAAGALITIGLSDAGAAAGDMRQRCLVPDVRSQSLEHAEKRLRAADCATGPISGPRNTVVRAQRPAAGSLERRGARVSLTMRRPNPPPASADTVKAADGSAAPADGVPGSAPAPPHAPPPSPTTTSPATTPAPSAPTTPTTPTTPSPTPTPPTSPNLPGSPGQPLGIAGDWRLVLDSEFDRGSLDTSIWRTGWFGAGTTAPANANEVDCYSPTNVTFPGDGTMHLNLTAAPSTCGGVTEPYTGAMVTTDPRDGRPAGGFQYAFGVLEARVYLPADGTEIADWPAVWADGQSWPADGENDLLEGLDGSACSTFHDPLATTRLCDLALTPGWHTFASDWEPGSVTYYYDGASIGTVTTGITSAPMFIALDNTAHAGYPAVTEPDAMQVQYVRVWQTTTSG